MSEGIINDNRVDNSKTTPIIRSLRTSCAAVVYSYNSTDITKLLPINAASDQSLGEGINSSTLGNLIGKDPTIIRQDIYKCTIRNSKDGGGSFSLSLKRGKDFVKGSNTSTNNNNNTDYLSLLNPGDWIALYLKRGQFSNSDLHSTTSESGLKFLGIIENVQEVETDDPITGTPSLEILVTGRSFSKVFDSSLFHNPAINKQTVETVLGASFLSDSSKSLNSISDFTADQVIKRVLQFYLKGRGSELSAANENWYIPQSLAQAFKGFEKDKKAGRAFYDILYKEKIGIHKHKNGKFESAQKMSGGAFITSLPSSGSIWSVMQFLQNPVINEMYTELTLNKKGNLVPAIIMRRVPFSNKPKHETNIFFSNKKYNKAVFSDENSDYEKTYFIDLPRHVINSSDIKRKSIGKSDHERINYTVVVPRVTSQAVFDIAYKALANTPSIQRYGLKVFNAQTSYVLSDKSDDDLISYCAKCTHLIADWFFLGHNLYNGTISIRGLEEHIEIGNNLYIEDIQQLFHIEEYTHTFSTQSSALTDFITELTISRGQLVKDSTAYFIASKSNPQDHNTVITSFLPRGGI